MDIGHSSRSPRSNGVGAGGTRRFGDLGREEGITVPSAAHWKGLFIVVRPLSAVQPHVTRIIVRGTSQ